MTEKVAIVGVGLIGGSLGQAMRERGLATSVVGIGRSAETLARAVSLGAIDSYATDFAEGVVGASLVVLATPVPQILSDLARLPALLAPGAIVTDVGSIKGEICAAGDTHLAGRFVGSHPMAGSEKAGVEAARPDLFVGATWVITPTEATLPNTTERVHAIASGVGAKVLVLPPDAHDKAVAVTSHLPHVLAFALAKLAGERAITEPHLFEVAAGRMRRRHGLRPRRRNSGRVSVLPIGTRLQKYYVPIAGNWIWCLPRSNPATRPRCYPPLHTGIKQKSINNRVFFYYPFPFWFPVL